MYFVHTRVKKELIFFFFKPKQVRLIYFLSLLPPRVVNLNQE